MKSIFIFCCIEDNSQKNYKKEKEFLFSIPKEYYPFLFFSDIFKGIPMILKIICEDGIYLSFI
jgi:hypothetical protein